MANHTTEHRTEDGRIIKPVSIPRQVGLYARREREAQGLTRKQLAKAAGVSERLLASLELGDAPGIRLDKLLAVYDALGLELFTIGEHIREERPWKHNESPTASDSASTAPATRTTAQHHRRGARVTTAMRNTRHHVSQHPRYVPKPTRHVFKPQLSCQQPSSLTAFSR